MDESLEASVELAVLPGGGLVLAGTTDVGLFAALLSDDGRLIEMWIPDPPVGLGLSGLDLAVDPSSGRTWLAYPAGPAIDSTPNPVLLQEVGCAG